VNLQWRLYAEALNLQLHCRFTASAHSLHYRLYADAVRVCGGLGALGADDA
jgi:DUF1365 family protein